MDCKKSLARNIITIILATAINYAASRLAGFISFPLYLDSISTFFVAATCGLVPALIVACLSNLLLAIFATTAIPFLLCHLMTAFFAHLVFRRGTSAAHFLIAGLFSALSNTALGSTFSLILFSGNTTIPTVDNAVQGIYLATNNLPFAVYWGGTLTNLIDKSLSSFVCYLVFLLKSYTPPHTKILRFPIKSILFFIAIINLATMLYFSSRTEKRFSYFEDLAYKSIYTSTDTEEKIDIQKDFHALVYFNDEYKTASRFL